MSPFIGDKINNSISGPIHIDYGSSQNKFLVDSKNNLICIAQDATQAELEGAASPLKVIAKPGQAGGGGGIFGD